jgi:hypothetical protein
LLIRDPALVNNGRLLFCDGTILCPEFLGVKPGRFQPSDALLAFLEAI